MGNGAMLSREGIRLAERALLAGGAGGPVVAGSVSETEGSPAVPLPKGPVPYARLECITPDRAKALFAKNGPNRKISEPWVKSLARDISTGSWYIDGNTIRISSKGRLLDGQHRLNAIIQANKPVWCFVVYELDERAMGNIDRGRSRSLGDLFKINKGLRQSVTISAIVGQLAAIEMVQARSAGFYGKTRLSYSEAESLYGRYEPHIEWVLKALGKTIEPGIFNGGGPTMAGFVFMRSIPRCMNKVEHFAKRFKTGQGLKADRDPAEALRRMCANMANNDGGAGVARGGYCAKTLRAIEADLKEEKLTILKVDEHVVSRVLKLKEEGVARYGGSS